MFLFFDAVGTLIRPEPDAARVYHRMGTARGSSLDLATIQHRFRVSYHSHFENPRRNRSLLRSNEEVERCRWQALVADVFFDISTAELFEDLWKHFSQPSNWRLFEDVPIVLERCLEVGINYGIASNFDQRLAGIAAGFPGLAQSVSIVTSAAAGWSKPAPEFFQFAAEQSKSSTTELWMIGDHLEFDYQAARNAGWQAVHLNRERYKPRGPQDISSLMELWDVLPDWRRRL